MTYYAVNLIVYIISIFLAMIALNCFHFDRFLRKGKQKEFYLFYIMASCVFGYLLISLQRSSRRPCWLSVPEFTAIIERALEIYVYEAG